MGMYQKQPVKSLKSRNLFLIRKGTGSFVSFKEKGMEKMTEQDIAVKLAEYGKEIGSAKHRLDSLEEQTEVIRNLVLSVKELAINMQGMSKEQERYRKTQERIFSRIENLENEPAKNWNTLTTVILTALVSGLAGYVVTMIFK